NSSGTWVSVQHCTAFDDTEEHENIGWCSCKSVALSKLVIGVSSFITTAHTLKHCHMKTRGKRGHRRGKFGAWTGILRNSFIVGAFDVQIGLRSTGDDAQ